MMNIESGAVLPGKKDRTMITKESPIGVIDSGIGGFSVARKVQKLMPHENLLYLGDGANTPYGNHSAEEILTMTRYMLRFMEDHGVKALLVACNTISCVIGQCEGEVSCPTFNAVQVGAEAAARLSVDKIGVISTVFTHNSRCYPEGILARSPKKLVVLSCGCPDLARLVEHNLGDPAGMAEVEADLRLEMDGIVREGIQCCVLGCTHYPLLRSTLRRLMGEDVVLVNPAYETAIELKQLLEERGLERDGAEALQGEKYQFFVSDLAEKFTSFATSILPNEVKETRKIDIENY